MSISVTVKGGDKSRGLAMSPDVDADPLSDPGALLREAKRLGLALGLMVPRPVLLLDEPFDGLDLRQARQAMDVLRRDAARGRTMVLSIHQLTDAARVCDRFLLLNGGRSVAEGTLAELGGNLEEAFLALT